MQTSKLFLYLIILLMAIGVFACAGKTDKEEVADLWNKNKLISSISYQSDGVTESHRVDYKYDEQGREIGRTEYVGGKLKSETKNYVYNNNVLTYDEDDYHYCNPECYSFLGTNKWEIEFYDDSCDKNKIISSKQYFTYGDYFVRKEYVYDEQAREIDYAEYIGEKLMVKTKNYLYDANTLTYDEERYQIDSSLLGDYKRKVIFYGNGFNKWKIVSSITYRSDGTESERDEYLSDEKGREISSKFFYGDKLACQSDDYIYNDNELTFIKKDYELNDSLVFDTKMKFVFYPNGKNKIISYEYSDRNN